MERSKKRRSSILKSNNNDQTLRSENTVTSRRVSFSRSKNVQEYIIGNPPAESTYVEPYTHDISSLRHTEDEDSKALSLPSSIDDEQSFCNKSIIYSPSHSDEPHGNGTLHQTADMDMTVFMSDTSDDQNDIENLIEQKANESFYKLFKEDSNNTMCHSTRMDMTVFQSNESKEENIESLIQEKAEESFALINSEKEVHFNIGNEVTVTEPYEMDITKMSKNHGNICNKENIHLKYQEETKEKKTSSNNKTLRQSIDMDFTVLKGNGDRGGKRNYNKPNNKNCTINVGVEMDLTTNECVMFEDPIEKDIRLYSEQEVVDPLIESIAQRKLPESHFHHKTDQNESTWKKKSKSISQVMIDKEENLENGSAKKYANPHKKRCLDYEVYDKENLHRTTQKEGNVYKKSIDKTIRQSMDMEFTVTNLKDNFSLKKNDDLGDQNNFKKSERKNCTVVEAVEMDLSADEDSVFLSTSKSDMGLCSKQERVNVPKKSDSLRQLPEPLLNQVVPIESKGTMDIKNETKNSANDQSIIGHEDGLTKINKICVGDKEDIHKKSINKTIRQSMDMEFTVTNRKKQFPLKNHADLGDQNNFKKSERKNCTVVEAVEMDLSADEDSVFLSTSKSDMGLCSKQEGVNVSKKTDSLRQLPESFHYKNNLAESELKTSVKSKIHGQEKHSGDYDLMGLNAKKIRMMPSGNDLIKTHLHNELEIVNSGSHVRNEDDYKKECERPKNLEVPLGLNEKSKDIQQSKKVEEGITNKATDLIVDGTNRKMNNTSSHDLDGKKKYATIQKTHINHIHSEISIPQEVDVEVNPSSKTFHKERNYSSGSTLESKNDNINSYSTNEREYENIHISGSSLTINSESQEENQTANRNTILNPSQSDRSTPQKLMPSTALTPVFKTISKEKDVESMKLSPSSFFESSKSKMTKSNAHELHSKNENTRCSQDTTSDLNAFINGSNLERENWLPQIETPPMSNKRMLNDSDHVPSNNSSYSETYNSFRVDVSGEDSVQEKNNPCMKPIINIFNYYEKEQLSFEDGYKYTDFHIEQMSDHLVTLSFMEGKFKLDFYIEKLCSVEEKENILIQHCKINDVVGLVQYTQSDAFVNMVLGLVDSILLKSNMLKGIMRITNRFKDFLGLIRSHLSSACKMIIAETKIFHSHPGSGLDKKNPKVYRVLFSGFYFYFRMNINFESGLDYIRKSVSCSLSEGGCNIDFILDLAQKSKQSWLFFEDYIKKIDLYVKYMDALYVKSLDIKSS